MSETKDIDMQESSSGEHPSEWSVTLSQIQPLGLEPCLEAALLGPLPPDPTRSQEPPEAPSGLVVAGQFNLPPGPICLLI
jgi:hypothetical protein